MHWLIVSVLILFFEGCSGNNVGTDKYSDFISSKEQADSVRRLIVDCSDFSERNIRLLSEYYIHRGEQESLVPLLKSLYSIGIRENNNELALCSGSFLATSYMELDKQDSMCIYLYPVLKIDSLYPDINKYYSGMIHNLAAIHSMRNELDYVNALRHYQIALNVTEKQGDSLNLSIILANMGKIFSTRKDTAGLKYVKTALQVSRNTGNDKLKARLLILLADQWLLRGCVDSAYLCIPSIFELIDSSGFEQNNVSLAHLLAGKTMAMKGKQQEAENHFKAAVASICDRYDRNGYDVPIYMAYGDLKNDMGQYDEAIELYREGLAISEQNKNSEYSYELYRKMSDTYEMFGNLDSALFYCKRYATAYADAFTYNREKEFYELRRKYDELNRLEQMQKIELSLLRSKRKNELIIFVSTILFIVASISIILYRKEWVMRRRLLNQYLAFNQRMEEKELQKNKKKDSAAEFEVFDKIENLMRQKKLYRKPDLSLEKMAEILNINSAALSKAINEFSELTFPQYVGRYRIQEAAEILSDAERSEPIKSVAIIVGYTTFSTFYRAFIKETGLSPTHFRQEVMKKVSCSQ